MMNHGALRGQGALRPAPPLEVVKWLRAVMRLQAARLVRSTLGWCLPHAGLRPLASLLTVRTMSSLSHSPHSTPKHLEDLLRAALLIAMRSLDQEPAALQYTYKWPSRG